MSEIGKNILIVCEGQNTETGYFASIRDYLIDKQIKITIKIVPSPKIDVTKDFILRAGAKKRELKILDASKEKELAKEQLEEKYRAQPTRYVRIAQKGLEEGVYDEAWAVYDKDQHPNHKEAFDLSRIEVNGKNVNIGFTSISFEHWILLHFELNTSDFVKSQCRIDRDIFDCGHNKHASDCKGKLCVCGYLVTKQYFKESLIHKEFSFTKLPECQIPIENAINLKRKMESQYPGVPFFEINPYTTVHRLVFRLVVFPLKVVNWFNCEEEIHKDEIAFNVSVSAETIFIQIRNKRDQHYIIQTGDFTIVDVNGKLRSIIERSVLNPLEERDFPFNPAENGLEFPSFVGYKMSNSECFICDL